jgi:hypothetical protein
MTSSRTRETSSRCAANCADRFFAVVGHQHAMALGLQDRLRHLADAFVVVGHKNGFVAAANRLLLDHGGFGFAGLRGFIRRQKNPEGASLADLAFHLNKAVVLFDDAVHRGQPQAGALSHRLGGEEGLEDPFARGGVHAGTRVAYEKLREGPRLQSGVAAAVLRGELDVARFDGQTAAGGHGVARIDAQVHEHLLNLRGVGAHRK